MSRNSIVSSDLTLHDQKNKMTANMAKFGIQNGYISSSMTARDIMLVSLLWFEVKEFNDVVRFNIRR